MRLALLCINCAGCTVAIQRLSREISKGPAHVVSQLLPDSSLIVISQGIPVMKHAMLYPLGAISVIAVNIDPAEAQRQEQSVFLNHIPLRGELPSQWFYDPSYVDGRLGDAENRGRAADRQIVDAWAKFDSAIGLRAGVPLGSDLFVQRRF